MVLPDIQNRKAPEQRTVRQYVVKALKFDRRGVDGPLTKPKLNGRSVIENVRMS